MDQYLYHVVMIHLSFIDTDYNDPPYSVIL